MKNKILIIFLVLSNAMAFSQEKELNAYQYLIVRDKFDFLKEKNQYQTSALTAFLLRKNGFTVVLDSEEYPAELRENLCKALYVEVVDKSSMFSTKVVIQFRDCFKKRVFSSKEGASKSKEYKESYQQAIRNAHATMAAIKHSPLKEKVSLEAMLVPADSLGTPPAKVVLEAASLVVQNKITSANTKRDFAKNMLYAQPTKNGFQLINLKPEVVFILLNTSSKERYIISDKNGILYKRNAVWVAEYYENDSFVEKEYQIKF